MPTAFGLHSLFSNKKWQTKPKSTQNKEDKHERRRIGQN